MRIAVDARELRGKPTGVGRFLSELLTAWTSLPAASGHEFVMLAPDENARRRGTLWEQLVLPKLVRASGADVLFSPAYSGPACPPVPMVVAIHDVSFFAHPEWFNWREGARRRTTVRLAARAARRVVTISLFSKREIAAHLGVDPSKIVVTYPGVTSLCAVDAHRSTQDAVEPRVLFVGSIFNRRHIPTLLEGFARVVRAGGNVSLDIVGDNRTSPRINLEHVVQAAGLTDRVRLRSYVTDEELQTLYSSASAFAFLSEYEGFGLTPAEAMAAGLPVLLLDTPVAREIWEDAALYVSRPDAALVEAGLTTILFDAAARQRLLHAAARVRARYSWTECASQVLHVLLECGRG
jgi:glycosyltransferase involved in cell wall biosynthesis